MFYTEIFEKLYKEKIEYLLVGGLAVNLHGVPRSTQDIDLIVSVKKDNIVKLTTLLNKLDYVPKLPVDPVGLADSDILSDWINNKNLKAFSFFHKKNNYKVIDVVLAHPLDFEKAFDNKKEILMGKIKVYLASIDDLITMKKFAARPRDLSDVEMLEDVNNLLGKK
ncbi:MAG: hypothetical protein JXA66_07630 [Oligoflexia bacterium]|nr:hypothetical protein [Oligoflexia bacterium]